MAGENEVILVSKEPTTTEVSMTTTVPARPVDYEGEEDWWEHHLVWFVWIPLSILFLIILIIILCLLGCCCCCRKKKDPENDTDKDARKEKKEKPPKPKHKHRRKADPPSRPINYIHMTESEERIEMEKHLFLNNLADDLQPLGYNAGHVKGKWYVDSKFKPSAATSTTSFQV